MTYRTNRDQKCTAWENVGLNYVFTLPKGTRVCKVRDGMGFDHYAVDDVPLLVKLTGNSHDPHYRYVWVPDEAVEQVD